MPQATSKRRHHSAAELVRMVGNRHTRDLFFAEVKNGPTNRGRHRRLDALAIRKTWSPITLVGYEVKVARGDWLGDEKWAAYKSMCHQLYLVAPDDVARTDEIPTDIGILRPPKSEKAKRLRLERKAHRREIELPGETLLYLMFWQMEKGDPTRYGRMSRAAKILHYKGILEDDKEGRRIGAIVGEKVRERLHAAEKNSTRGRDLEELDAFLAKHHKLWGSVSSRLEEILREVGGREARLAERALRVAALRASKLLGARAEGGEQ